MSTAFRRVWRFLEHLWNDLFDFWFALAIGASGGLMIYLILRATS